MFGWEMDTILEALEDCLRELEEIEAQSEWYSSTTLQEKLEYAIALIKGKQENEQSEDLPF